MFPSQWYIYIYIFVFLFFVRNHIRLNHFHIFSYVFDIFQPRTLAQDPKWWRGLAQDPGPNGVFFQTQFEHGPFFHTTTDLETLPYRMLIISNYLPITVYHVEDQSIFC